MMSTELDFSFGSRIGCAVAVTAKAARNRPATTRDGRDGSRWVNAIDYLCITLKDDKLTYVIRAGT